MQIYASHLCESAGTHFHTHPRSVLCGFAFHTVNPLKTFFFTLMCGFAFSRGVKRGLIYALSMILLSLPHHVILTDLQSDVIQAKEWLQGRYITFIEN